MIQPKIELVNKKYKIYKNIGQGKFGTIYMARNIKTNENVAIKVEYNGSQAILKHEAKMLKYLNEKGEINIPLVYWFGPYSDNIVLVMPCYDYSLHDDILNGNKYNITDINVVCITILRTIEYIHSKYVIHRDLKPQNIMIKNGKIYLIDFGISTFYINEFGEHIINKKNETILGSPKYISWNIHNGDTPSRRDDLISVGYIYLLLTMGNLYWSSIINEMNGYNNSDISITSELNEKYKMEKGYENLIQRLDGDIKRYMEHCYKLGYNENPNYNGIYQIFII